MVRLEIVSYLRNASREVAAAEREIIVESRSRLVNINPRKLREAGDPRGGTVAPWSARHASRTPRDVISAMTQETARAATQRGARAAATAIPYIPCILRG